MRNFGLEVRAGGPRRSQAISLRSRFCRRASVAAATPLPLGAGQGPGRVAALVRPDRLRRRPPRSRAHRVQEPPVVGDHDQRAAPARSRCSASQAMPATSRWLVGSSRISRSEARTSSAASATRRRSPPDMRPDRGVQADAGHAESVEDGPDAGVAGPLVLGGERRRQPGGAEHHVADGRVGGQVERLRQRGDAQVAPVGDPAGVRAPRPWSAAAAGWTCRRR